MDNRRLILTMVLASALFMGWTFLAAWYRAKHPEYFPQTPPGDTPPAATPAGGGGQAVAPTPVPTTQAPGPTAVSATANVLPASLGSHDFDPKASGTYALGLTIDPRGAALTSVTLNQFRKYVDRTVPYVFQQPYTQGSAGWLQHALATQGLLVNGQWVDLFHCLWERGEVTSDAVTYTASVQTATGPLRVHKDFRVRPAKEPGLGYEVAITHRLVNEGTAALTIVVCLSGPTTPHVENTRDIPEVAWGSFRDGKFKLDHHPASSYSAEEGPVALAAEGQIIWAGMVGTYFNALIRPGQPAPDKPPVDKVQVQVLAKPATSGETFVALTFTSAEVPVAAGGEAAWPIHAYFGPRRREVLNDAHYAEFRYGATLVMASGMCGWCTFDWLVNVLVWLLNMFHVVVRDWGLAIIALVCLVRLLLHPITKKSQVMMSQMSKLAPEMERLKKKHGDNKEELQREMMQLYKEQGFTPILGCLPMFLQMPIWIALWSSLQSTFELRHASFLWGWTWIKDLSQPDRLLTFAPVDFWFFHVDGLNILPVLLAGVFWLQQKIMPKPPAMNPQQEQQQKMMQWMTLLFPLLLYSGPAGLNLYILASTSIGIVESKIIRKHIQEREEAEKAGKVVVEAGSASRSRHKATAPVTRPAPRGGLSGWLTRLQQMAEEAQREAGRRKKHKP
jgi:YidC/Oxa1 family membrane protein insertase